VVVVVVVELNEQFGIDLENITYYRGDTHYLVMTAKKQSLLNCGVLINDFATGAELVQPDNIDHTRLREYVMTIARSNMLQFDFALDFASTQQGAPDVSIFDFTEKRYAISPSKLLIKPNHAITATPSTPTRQQTQSTPPYSQRLLFVSLIGDALIEPFFPLGTGANRAVLSAIDAAYAFASLRRAMAAKPTNDTVDTQQLQRSIDRAMHEHQQAFNCLKQSLEEHLHDASTPSYCPEPKSRYRLYRQLPSYISFFNAHQLLSSTASVSTRTQRSSSTSTTQPPASISTTATHDSGEREALRKSVSSQSIVVSSYY
jgi:hypothetical protein